MRINVFAPNFLAPSFPTPAPRMFELSDIMSAEQLAKVDPRVRAFYKDPTKFDGAAGVDLTHLGSLAIPIVALLAKQGDIPDRVQGFENYPVRQTIETTDRGVRWRRMIQVDGEWRTLFDATVRREGKYLVETFRRGPIEVPVYFTATPYAGGVRLSLDAAKSSPLYKYQNVTFTTVANDEGGLTTTGAISNAFVGDVGSITLKLKEKK